MGWRVHRALYRLSGGRFLWTTSNKRGWGVLRLTTLGRKSGQERSVIIGYVEDGADLAVLAINGWDEGYPSWWLNLKAHPDAVVRLAGRPARPVRARPVAGEERDRLWQRWVAVEPKLDGYASRRSTETAMIVLEPSDGPVDARREGCPGQMEHSPGLGPAGPGRGVSGGVRPLAC
jgi:deazaflavin-dependent oxidoreductase (nitroreductase family)